MKKMFLLPFIVLMMISLSVFAEDTIKVILNDREITFDEAPMVKEGRTFVPLRALFEALDASIVWDGETQTIAAKRGDTTVSLTIGNTVALVNNESITLDAPAFISNGRTLVPLRFVSESLGTTVQWDGETRTVKMKSESSSEDLDQVVQNKKAIVNTQFTKPNSPVSKLTEAIISELSITIDKDGSDELIANEILQWQHANMSYIVNPQTQPDVSDPMRWNYFRPGVYTTNDMINLRKNNGKVYGICYDYALMFGSIADYYGLEVRITNMKEKPSEIPTIANALNTATANGMSPDEYKRYSAYLKEKNIEPYPYDVVRLLAKETSTHYRAEVKLNGKWVPYDGSPTTDESWTSQYTFYETDWNEGFDQAMLDKYLNMLSNGESLKGIGYTSAFEEFQEGRLIALEDGRADQYIGMTDALGNKNRAQSFDDLMQGLGLSPYLENMSEFKAFMGSAGYALDDVEEAFGTMVIYEKQTGEKFYMIPYFMGLAELDDDDDGLNFTLLAEEYFALCGSRINEKMMQEIYHSFD